MVFFFFLVPSGKVVILELARLYANADNTTVHLIAFTACFVFKVLLSQKPHVSKTKDHITCLEHHLNCSLIF